MRNIFLIIGAETGGDFLYIDIFLKQNFLMNFLVLSLTCVFCKSAVCHRNLRMLAAAVSGTGLEAFGLMVLPYAISVLCTAIGIVPLMVFLAFGRENKKQRMVRVLSSWLSIVLLNEWQLQFTI